MRSTQGQWCSATGAKVMTPSKKHARLLPRAIKAGLACQLLKFVGLCSNVTLLAEFRFSPPFFSDLLAFKAPLLTEGLTWFACLWTGRLFLGC